MKKNLIKITRIEIGFGFAVAGFLVPLIFLLYFFGRYLGEILWAILMLISIAMAVYSLFVWAVLSHP